MTRFAIKDTYGIEKIGDAEVRRKIMAGTEVPAHLEVPDSDVRDSDAPQPSAPVADQGGEASSEEPESGSGSGSSSRRRNK